MNNEPFSAQLQLVHSYLVIGLEDIKTLTEWKPRAQFKY